MSKFTHLHVHTQYSILDGAASIEHIVQKAKADGMTAVAITDHGYMHGVKEFFNICKQNDIKALLGCEVYVAQRSIADKSDKVDRSGRHLVLIAKNRIGYQNLLALCTVASTEGFYFRPRIDKALLEKHKEGLIVSSACLGGEVPKHIENGDIEEARKSVMWFKKVFGDDYYLELQRHRTNDPKLKANVSDKQDAANKIILELAKECGVKVIATNDVHFVNEEDAEAHDLLVCLSTAANYSDENRLHYTQQEWFKTHDEMLELFSDVPEAIYNTYEIADKVEFYNLNSKPIMPFFPIPEEFGTEELYLQKFTPEEMLAEFGEEVVNNAGSFEKIIRIKLEADYLEHLTYKGAKKRFGENICTEIQERIDFELSVIKQMGFPGYFLITQDFINEAKEMGVLVGPGRGSAAGSVVSYCIGITNIDPIKHELLFERFLNPDRISMPDVDVDFDDDGRQLVLDWVCDKYGYDKVAHICTFGSLAAKSAIKDVARAFQLPLSEANRLAKMVPEAAKMTLKKAYKECPDLEREKYSMNPLISSTVRLAESLEGSIRQTGAHACGILICGDKLSNHIPLMPTKGGEKMLSTQFDGRFVEEIGLIKMDFLGLKTLSILKEAVENIRLSKNVIIDLDHIPEDDAETYKLFSEGATTGIFQFESPGMKKHLQALKPDCFDNLVAMNALYRPGPMEYIPKFISRRFGRELITYEHPLVEPFLKDTYGITVYQEQVMLLSRELAGFSRGESDNLRKAMGKKKPEVMAKIKEKFVSGCLNNPRFIDGLRPDDRKDPNVLVQKMWRDWEAFASYAFNKSHSVCYADIAYRTAYLKAHYPAEFMAGTLSRNLADIKRISEFMDECKRMHLEVKGPDVNESYRKFTVNKKGELRFGLAGVKGVGEAVVEHIIEERERGGVFVDIYNFAERVNLRTVSKKSWESLAFAGAFDSLGEYTRSQFFDDAAGSTFIEQLLRYGNVVQDEKKNNANSLFGMFDEMVAIKKPEPPKVEAWSRLQELEKEKEMIGIYLSGHPLDDYAHIIERYCNASMLDLGNEDTHKEGDQFKVAGIVTAHRGGTTKRGDPYGVLTVEDFSGSYDFFLFGEKYADFSKYFQYGFVLLIEGEYVVHKWKKEKKVELQVKSMKLLSEIKDRIFKQLRINVDNEELSEELLEDLCTLLEENKSHNPKEGAVLYMSIRGEGASAPVSLKSRSERILINKKFIDKLEDLSGIYISFK